MIFAAGLGTRFKPWTDAHPKALAIVNGKSLLQRNIEYLQQFNITDVLVNVHHFAEQIINELKKNNNWGSKITISDETNIVLETGGGLKKASWFFNDEKPFAVINADILTDLDLHEMILFHKKNNPLSTLATTNRETSRYFLFDNNNNLCGWRNVKTNEEKGFVLKFSEEEKKEVAQKAFSGIHIIDPKIFPLITQEGKFSIVDVYLQLSPTEIIKSFDHSNTKLVDVGKPESLIIAEKLFP